jgi:protein phosphatase 2C family protein 2/3
MTTKSEAPLSNNLSGFSTKPMGYDNVLNKFSNTSIRKTATVLSPQAFHKQASQNNLNPEATYVNSGIPSANTSQPIMNYGNNSQPKTQLKSLTIETNEEAEKYHGYNNYNHQGSYSATNNQVATQYGLSKNSLISNLNGTLTAKYSRGLEANKSQAIISPNKALMTAKYIPTQSTGSLSTVPNQMISNPITYNPALSNNTSPSNISNQLQKMSITKSLTFETAKSGLSSNVSPSMISMQSPSHQNQSSLMNSSNNNSAATLNSVMMTHGMSHGNNLGSPSNSASMAQGSNSNSNQSLNALQSPTGSNMKKVQIPLPNHEPTKCSVKRNGIVKAYAANTNQGIVRNYNEDRVSIILNIMKPASRINETWPKCSFFGVYDGHGGVACADFLRDNLHQFVIKETSFPWNPKEALMKGFEAAEKHFLDMASSQPSGEIERSGSCAIVVLIVGEMCYVANVGDSRAVLSGDSGAKVFPLSRDHKPMDDLEQKRIIEAGGRIYQTQASAYKPPENGMGKAPMQLLVGPHRVLPGRLSVSRTFGDIEAKVPKLGGNPNVVVAIPEIKTFKIAPEHDFIVLASDGVFDKLNSREVIKSVWDSTEQERAQQVHQQCGVGVESILRESINRRTLDNITVVMICFKNFKQRLFPRTDKKVKDNNENVIEDKNLNTRNTPQQTLTQLARSPTAASSNIRNTKFFDKKDEQENALGQSLSQVNSQPSANTDYLKRPYTEKPQYNPSFTEQQAGSKALSKKLNSFHGGTLNVDRSENAASISAFLKPTTPSNSGLQYTKSMDLLNKFSYDHNPQFQK